MKYDAATIQDWFEQLEEHADALTKWEYEFVASLQEQFERRGSLSDRQVEVLEKIYAEKTP